jgi:cytochrome b involved in lipid metabolism
VEFPGREKEPARPGQRLQLILTFRDFVGFFLEGAGCLGFCMMKVVSAKELKEHKTWLAIEGNVYDVEDFLESHPGGPEIISEVLGADGKELIGLLLLLFFFLKKKKKQKQKTKATAAFCGDHSHSQAARDLLPAMQVGVLAGSTSASSSSSSSSRASQRAKEVIDPSQPYTFQVGRLGDLYQEWVHQPIHVKARKTRFFFFFFFFFF